MILAARKKTPKKACFFLYSARSPHRTAKPSRECLPLAHPRALPAAVVVSDRRSPSAMFELPFECLGCKPAHAVPNWQAPKAPRSSIFPPSAFGGFGILALNKTERSLARLFKPDPNWHFLSGGAPYLGKRQKPTTHRTPPGLALRPCLRQFSITKRQIAMIKLSIKTP